jgi:hypothetical protein
MVNQQDKMRPPTLRTVSSLETGPAQPDPALRPGRASGIYGFMTAVAVIFILGVVFYGLNAQRPEGIQTASAPNASTPAPTGANPTASTTTGQFGAQTTGQATPMRDNSGAGTATGEGSGGVPQQSPQDARNRQGGATQATTNPR